jgi:short-subunit dehydrogenase
MSKFKILIYVLFVFSHQTMGAPSKKAIIIGASSGMGREVAKLLSKDGYTVGLVARRVNLLESLQKEISGQSYIKQVDVTDPHAREQLSELISQMGGLDLIVISISAYLDNQNTMPAQKPWSKKERTLNVDAKGFIAMADVALDFFERQNHGHLVGVSSTSGLRGVAYNPEYSAAKACISYYMEAQRNYMIQNNIDVQITDICPGYVAVEHSPLGQDPAAYWEIPVQEAGKVIFEGIKNKSTMVYVPKKVQLIALLLKHLPDCIYNKYCSWL